MEKLFIAMFLLLAICDNAHAGWRRVSSKEIRLDGEIGRNSYEEYLKVAEGGFKVVTLNSGGGYPLVALSIADDLVGKRIVVVIDGVCLSACANYLAVSGATLFLKCDSIVAWHGTLGSVAEEKIKLNNSGVPSNVIDAYIDWLGQFKDREELFFKNAKVDMRILQDSVRAVDKSGIAPESKFTLDRVTGEYSYTSIASMWVPTIEDMRSYGINVRSECGQRSDDQIVDSLKKLGISSPFTTMHRAELGIWE